MRIVAGGHLRSALRLKVRASSPADVAAIRWACGRYSNQETFAAICGVSVGTLRNWEQGRRKPTGAARALLVAIAADPDAYIRAIAQWNGA